MQIWEGQKSSLRSYGRRKPEITPFYRVASSAHEELLYCWEEQFQPQYGVLRDEVRVAFERYLSCGILAHGCAHRAMQNER